MDSEQVIADSRQRLETFRSQGSRLAATTTSCLVQNLVVFALRELRRLSRKADHLPGPKTEVKEE
jgi:hypothetical protein